MIKISEIEERLKTATGGHRLNSFSYITDVRKYIDNHLSYLRANKGRRGYLPYYHNLIELLFSWEAEQKNKASCIGKK